MLAWSLRAMGTYWKLGLLLGLWWLFLSQVSMSVCTLIMGLLLLTSDDVLSQEALLLWEQAVSRDVTLLPPQWFPTGGNTAAGFLSGHDMTQWIFMWDKKVFKPLLDRSRTGCSCFGGCCRNHGPYGVGPFSATNLKKGLLHQ